jgi:hypothetical protein
MAAGLGFKEFTVGDILTAADANGYLASQTVMVFASSAARSSAITSPQEGMFSFLKDTNSTEFYTGTAWTALGGGGGKVLQVVQATTSTRVDITSTTYTDSGLTASITPTLNTSKILVMVSQHARSGRSTDENGSMVKIVRGATDIWNAPTAPSLNTYAAGATATQITAFQTLIYLDSPATTSSTTYKTQWKVETTANSGEISLQVGSNVSTITLMEIGA